MLGAISLQMSDTIYHYCSLESFEGIIKNKNLRLSNAFKTNDNLELKWIFQVMKEMSIADYRFIAKLEYIYELSLNNFYRPHMICFSGVGDLLSQWRGYANWGLGISLGFDKNYFINTQEKNANKEFKIYDVIYARKTQEREIKKLFKNFASESEINKIIKADLQYADNFFALAKIGEELFKMGIMFKNPAFNEEKEMRIVHGYPGLAAEPDMFKYKFTANNIISFIEIPIDNKDHFPIINEIVIGPRSNASIYDVKNFMETNFHYHIDLKYFKSNCSLI